MATLTKPHKPRQPLPPATGKVRWISKPTTECFYGRIAVAVETKRGTIETEYDLAAVTDKHGKIIGLGLAKDDDTIYHIDISQPWGWNCDCPSETYEQRSPGTCKHCRAARQVLAVLGITIPAPKKQTVAIAADDEFDNP
jgi:hypothetical protein